VLLLKPKTQGHGEAIPRLGLIVAFGWAGYEFLTPALFHRLHGPFPELLPAFAPFFPWGAALTGLIFGWLASPTVNRLLGRFFRVFNRGFGIVTSGYVGSVRILLRVSLVVLLVYGGLF